jgi:hypothetical protein
MELVEMKEKSTASQGGGSRAHARARRRARVEQRCRPQATDLRFIAHIPEQVNLKVEFEIEDDGSELEIELT